MPAAFEVLRVFLRLGLMSFGGPVAHIGYFRAEFVERRRWLDERAYVDLVALCQFLPGPASSQVGFSIGLLRAGYSGGLAAWAGFTLPSAALLTAFALGAGALQGRLAEGALHGLKLAAVAVVAQAVLGMARSLAPDRVRASIAIFALAVVALAPGSLAQIAAIAAGGVAGLAFCRETAPRGRRRRGVAGLAARRARFSGALLHRPRRFVPAGGRDAALFDAFYRSGALVFGGGHVVLPLLRAATVAPGWVCDGAFLQGYGAAQAVPGPLFTFAAYLGAAANVGPGGVAAAPLRSSRCSCRGLLALMGALPFWRELSANSRAPRSHGGAECGGGRPARGGALRSRVRQRRPHAGRFRRRRGGVRAADRLEGAAARRGGVLAALAGAALG